MKTKDRLAQALIEAGLPTMAKSASLGYYDDFLSPLDAPINSLCKDLAIHGTPEAMALRARAMAGEFDGTLAEADEWAASPEGQAILRRTKGGSHDAG